MQKAAKGQAIIWFEDRTMARARFTHGPMPSKGVPANKLPSILDVVIIKKCPDNQHHCECSCQKL